MLWEVKYFRGDFLKLQIENQVVWKKTDKLLQCFMKIEIVLNR